MGYTKETEARLEHFSWDDGDPFSVHKRDVQDALQRIKSQRAANTRLREALRPLVAIANAYDENSLDNEARKFWGSNDEHQSETLPEDIEMVSGRGGLELLTLQQCIKARAALKEGG